MSDDSVQITIVGRDDGLDAMVSKANAALKSLSTTVQGTTSGLAPLNAATAQTIAQYDKAAGVLSRAQHAFQATTDALEANEISSAQAARMMGQIANQADAATAAHGRLGHGTAGVTREFIVLGHEAMSGNFSRIPGSMMVLAERSGNLTGIIGALASPIGLVGIGLAATSVTMIEMAASAERADRSLITLQTSFAAVGNRARTNGADLKAVVDEVARLPGVNREAATEIVNDFARTRQIGGQLFAELTATIDKSARVMGVDAPAAAKTLASSFADPTKGAEQLDQQYGILKEGQLRQIETMQRQGDVIGAQNVLLSAWKARLAELPPGLTAIQTASNDLGNAWDRLMQSFGHVTAIQTARDSLAGLLELMAHHIDPTPLDNYNKALAEYNRIADRLAAEKNGPLAKIGLDPRVEALTKELQTAKANLDKSQQEMLKAAEPKSSETAPAATGGGASSGANSSVDLVKQAQALSQYNGVAAQTKAIDDDLTLLKKAYASATLDATKAEIQLKIAEAERQKEALTAKTGPSQMETWRAELAQQDAAQAASRADQLRADIAFWQAKRQLVETGSKDAVAIDKEVAQKQIALNREMLAEAKRTAAEKREIAKQDAATDAEISRIELATNKQLLEDGVAEGVITAQEKVQILKGFTEAAYQEDLTRLDNELTTLNATTKDYDRVYNEIRKLKASHNQEMANLDRQAATESKKAADANTKAWEGALAPISRAFSTSISGMIMGTQTLQQAEQRIAQNIVMSFVDAAQQMATKWIASKLAQLTATETADVGMAASGEAAAATEKATQSTSIMGHAGSTAAAVYDDVAQIPYVGWIMAPIAAAGAFAAVAAFSAEGGMGSVPYDNAPFLLHKNEMVLPASLAQGVRAMTSGTNISSTVGGSSSSSNVTLTHSPTVNISGGNGRLSQADVSSMLRDHSGTFYKFIKNAARNGVFG